MSDARQGHVGKSPREQRSYVTKVRGEGSTSDTPFVPNSTDELPADEEESFAGVATKRPETSFSQRIFQYLTENTGQIFWGLLGAAGLTLIGYAFVTLVGLNREVGENRNELNSQSKAIQRLDRLVETSLSDVKERVRRNEERLDRVIENRHLSPAP